MDFFDLNEVSFVVSFFDVFSNDTKEKYRLWSNGQ